MNSLNTNISIRQQATIQQTQQTQQTQQASETQSTSGTTAPSGMIEQDASDVARMGASGRLRIREGKQKEKEALQKIREGMSPEKIDKATEVETKSLGNFAKRRRSSQEMEDKDYARRDVEELLEELKNDFSSGEIASILQELKENPVVMKDVILKETIENTITNIIQESLSTRMEIASAGIMPNDGLDSSEKAAVREQVLGYTNQEEFLNQMESKVGIEKMNVDFVPLLSHTMAELSASMTSLSTAGREEKGAVYAAVAGISSLQQLTGVHAESSRLVDRMKERYPSSEQ